jgi:hypothetical protein
VIEGVVPEEALHDLSSERERGAHARILARFPPAQRAKPADGWALTAARPPGMYRAMKMPWPWIVLVTATAACGGGTRAAAPATQPVTAGAAPAATKASIDAFHDTLAPIWHAPAGETRMTSTCEAVPTLEARAQDVGDAPLVEAVPALGTECGGDRQGFEPRFAAVHDAFHAAMERSGVDHHEEHSH